MCSDSLTDLKRRVTGYKRGENSSKKASSVAMKSNLSLYEIVINCGIKESAVKEDHRQDNLVLIKCAIDFA